MRKYAKIILMCVCLFYAWCIYKYFTIPIKTDIVKYGVLQDVETTTGYIIREENLMYADTAGTFYSIANEGERVARGTRIASIYKGQIDPKIQEKIRNLNDRIAEISSNHIQSEVFAGDLYKLEEQIDGKVDEIVNISHTHKAVRISEIKEDINKILDKKLMISGEKGPVGNNLEALRKEKESYERQLNAAKVDLYSQSSGVFSYHIDGMEEILVPENVNQLTPEHFETLKNVQVKSSDHVEPGKPVAKIVDNFEWYLAVVMGEDKVKTLNAGEIISIGFPDIADNKIDASVHYISQKNNGKVVLVLLVNKQIDLPYTSREINVDIIKQSHSGFKIPMSAVRSREGKTGVYVIRDSIARFKEIEILDKNNEFVIAKENNLIQNGVLLYDQVIVKSDNIEEGNLIR